MLLASCFLLPAIALGCKPTTLIMTRATGSKAIVNDEGHLDSKYPLNGVNLANVHGALKYVISETIDIHTGVTNDTEGCWRKNWVNYIHFYKVTFCNPNRALWWFNPSRPSGYFNELGYDFKLFGDFLTFDGGECHDNINCVKLHGRERVPKLGPWVGFQYQTGDPRNPTDQAYWYSIPGDCPLKPWSGDDAKDEKCIKNFPSGRCPSDISTPDGHSCTWTYDFLGEVNLDHLSGITEEINPSTNATFESYEEFCQHGQVEFERDPDDFSMVQGLPFYDKPTSRSANRERVQYLLEHYHDTELYPLNKPIPTIVDNLPCYTSVRQCGDGSEDTRVCVRDDSQVCLYCDETRSRHCESDLPSTWKDHRFPELFAVNIEGMDPKDQVLDSSDTDRPNSDSDTNQASVIFINYVFTTLLLICVLSN